MNRGVLNIGLFGFGTVGRGLYEVLEETKLKEAHIKRVCVRDITKDRGVRAEFTDNPEEIFADPEINLVVELIDDAEASYKIVKRALEAGIPVVTGNKKMLAYHLEELIEITEDEGVIAILGGMIERKDRDEQLRQSTVPHAFILGRHDQYIPNEQAEEIERQHPEARIFWLEESGHMGFIEEPEKCAEAILSMVL